MKYECVCGYVYDPEVGDPDNGIAPGTAFEDLPEEKMDIHVKKTTKFSSWQEMLDWGTNQYILHQQK